MNFTTSCKSAVAGAVVLAAMVAGAGPTISAEPKAECETLFVQSAKSVTMDDKTLTLKGVSPMVTFFCDRPTRHAGHLTMTEFLQSWDHGKDSFTADPPNAVISVLDGDTADDVVVELLDKPNVNGDELTYNISIIDGEPTKKKTARARSSSTLSGGRFRRFLLQALRGARHGVRSGGAHME